MDFFLFFIFSQENRTCISEDGGCCTRVSCFGLHSGLLEVILKSEVIQGEVSAESVLNAFGKGGKEAERGIS